MMFPTGGVPQSTAGIEKLYGEYCSVCHGEKGDGNSHARQGLRPPPRDFTTPGLSLQLTRPYMIEVLRKGKPGTAMVGWESQLNNDEIEGLVDYIRTRFMGEAQSRQAKSGKHIYATSCSVCHGEDGAGALWGKTSLNPAPLNFSNTDPSVDLRTGSRSTLSSLYHVWGPQSQP